MDSWNVVKNGIHPNSYIYWLSKEENADWWAKIYQRNWGKWQVTFGRRGVREEYKCTREWKSLATAKNNAMKAIFSRLTPEEIDKLSNS